MKRPSLDALTDEGEAYSERYVLSNIFKRNRIMKKFIVLAVLGIFTSLGANAQYRGSHRASSPGYNRVLPSRRFGGYGLTDTSWRPYVGFRIGPTFSSVRGDKYDDLKTGVNVGLAAGFPLSTYLPMSLETGLYYAEKGGKTNYTSAKLGYLELPLVFKYHAYVGGGCTIQPYFGGFASLGVAGKIKGEGCSSFGDKIDQFRRGDAGIKLGCGIAFDMFYADVNYDWGLANISHSDYNDAHTSAITLNFGVNF